VGVMTDNDLGLSYEDLVPFSWHEVSADMPIPELLHAHESNEELLRSVSVLEEYAQDSSDDNSVMNHEIVRIECKVDMLMDMVASLLHEHIDIPDSTPIRLGGNGVQWVSETVPAVGTHVQISFYLNRKFPKPVVLFGQVVQSNDNDNEDEYNVTAIFEHMVDVVQSLLDKQVFRQHRRAVALERHA